MEPPRVCSDTERRWRGAGYSRTGRNQNRSVKFDRNQSWTNPNRMANKKDHQQNSLRGVIMSESKNQPIEIEQDDSLKVIHETMDQFLGAAHVSAVYGQPIEQDDTLIIPSAEIVSIAGFGVGSGYGTNEESDSGEKQIGGGGGGGGGGKVLSRPVAVIVASPDGVRVEPVVDPTKIALAFFTTFGFMVAMIARMMRKK